MKKKKGQNGIEIVIFSPGLAEIAEKYLKKGSLIYVEGQLRNRKYTDQSGMEKNISESCSYKAIISLTCLK